MGIVVPRASRCEIFCGKLRVDIKKGKKEQKRKKRRAVETDAADGNPPTPRILTAA